MTAVATTNAAPHPARPAPGPPAPHPARHADARDWEGVDDAVRGADQPILSGLKYILEHGVELDQDADPEWGWLTSKPSASCCQAWSH